MHKGVILLVKATDRDEALEKVNEFMEPYGDGDVWDWFAIGGRWNNTLAPKDKFDQWKEKAKSLFKDNNFISHKEVENNQDKLQLMWIELGLQGLNPYTDHYKLPDDGNTYDAVPLSECIATVNDWVRDLEKVKEEEFNELVKAKERHKAEGGWDMSAYHAGRYRDAAYNNFCFDSNVYDITEGVGERVPEDIEGYWAVMVDMHN